LRGKKKVSTLGREKMPSQRRSRLNHKRNMKEHRNCEKGRLIRKREQKNARGGEGLCACVKFGSKKLATGKNKKCPAPT